MSKRILTYTELDAAARKIATAIDKANPDKSCIGIYGVPRGGVSAMYLVLRHLKTPFVTVEDVTTADVVIDDLVDSGATAQRIREANRFAHFHALIHKTADGASGYKLGEWLVFPWEGTAEQSASDIVTRLLQFIGEDPTREGLRETPDRVLKAWREWTAGYKQDPVAVLKTFEDGAHSYDEMILERRIPFHSHCEHHLAPFFGEVHFAYIPGKDCPRIVGLSKMNRLVELFARRLQVQERLTTDIVTTFMDIVKPAGIGVVVKGTHTCVCSRGVRHTGCDTITSAYRGVMFQPATRQEFLTLLSLP